MVRDLETAVRALQAFRGEVLGILVLRDDTASRVLSLEQTRRQLRGLSLDQEELFDQACNCIRAGVYRAAFVMAWAAFIDFLERKLASDGLKKVKSVRPGWSKHQSIEELREAVTEHALIEAARDAGLITKSEMKSLLGLLAKRNECAHPSGYNPGMNEAIGYVAELLSRIDRLQGRSL